MTKVRECRRVPRLIEVTKQVIGSCAGLKKGITCRGRSIKMNSDVGKTFIGTEKWLSKLFVMRKSNTTSSGRDEKKTFTKMEVAVINNDDRNCQWKIGVVEYHIL